MLYFDPEDLPTGGGEQGSALYFKVFQSHAYWPVVAEEWGRPLDVIPFPAAVYVVNHSQNLSFGLQRTSERTSNIIAAIEQHSVDDGRATLAELFG